MARPLVISRYLARHSVRKLQLGAGCPQYEGWLNTDANAWVPGVVYLDVTKRFPIGDCQIDYVAAEHLIEHLTTEAALNMLTECRRVLRPGGKLRVATPSFENVISLYTHDKSELQRKYAAFVVQTVKYLNRNVEPTIDTDCFVINSVFHWWDHLFIYDRVSLQKMLEKAGFSDIRFHSAGNSDDEHFASIERHGDHIGEDLNCFETTVVEARRPAE